MRLLAPAKINLHLRIAPPVGGFHPLLSWMCTVGLFDTLVFSESVANAHAKSHAKKPVISLTCDDPTLTSATNLVVRAAEQLAAGLGDGKVSEPPLQLNEIAISLAKKIPMGGGLGGGSSDAAFTLIALNRLWACGLTTEQLSALGAKLGSDIAFFFFGPSSVCTGRGEIVRPIGVPAARSAVLVLPDMAMPTPAVYRQFDAMKLGTVAAVEEEIDWSSWTRLSAAELLPRLVNDLEPAAFALSPPLGRLRADTEQKIGRIVRMSGSGSTLFTLFDSHSAAATTARQISDETGLRAAAVELAPQLD